MLLNSFRYKERCLHLLSALFLALTLVLAPAGLVEAQADSGQNQTYTNPLHISIPNSGGQLVGSCADPSIIYGQDHYWYIYCTTDPLNDQDRNASGDLNFHLIPMHRSKDLVNWTYVGDAFSARPAWVASDAGLWAPDIEFFNNQYYLYFTASNTSLPGGGSAIGVATGPTPAGPWTDHGSPVVPPEDFSGAKRWVFDPAIIKDDSGQRYIFYGSYFGGVSARKLSSDGFTSDPASETPIAIPNRYEGTYITRRNGYYYFLGSATNCCNGPLTGYDVFVGRSKNLLGPYIDREGVSLLDSRVGGTPVITMNGNRWVGPGHNAVFKDFDGQYWTVYHAVDRADPYFAGSVGFTKRPVLLDPLDWQDGWPVLRGGLGPSDSPMPAPAAQPGDKTRYHPQFAKPAKPQKLESAYSDEFNSTTLSSQWQWVRPPAAGTFGLTAGTFRFDTQNADLYVDSNNASVLTEATPSGEYIVETKVKTTVPVAGCCFNYVQAGLVIYKDDDNFIKLADVSIWETRQTEFAKELSPVPAGYPRYGNTVVGPPGDWAYLRVVKTFGRSADQDQTDAQGGANHSRPTEEIYTPYTSRDGITWEKGGAWTHKLGDNARIGLVSMGGSGFTANFDYVRVYRLNPRSSGDREDDNTYSFASGTKLQVTG